MIFLLPVETSAVILADFRAQMDCVLTVSRGRHGM